jgi:crotonobetainyl-CoA:carnitine CoA-transferase CaiB-like acyl-CoA transferase
MYAHAAVLEALFERQRDGRGRAIQVSLFDSVADWMTVPLLHFEHGGAAPPRAGLHHPSIAPYGAYRCGDGAGVVIAIQNDREWARFCDTVLVRPELADHPDYRRNVDRCANRAALDAAIVDVLSRLSREQAVERLEVGAIAFASLNSVADLSGHEALRRADMDTPSGPVRMVSPPAIVDGSAHADLRPVPALGEHTDAVRLEFSAADRSVRS